MLQQQQNLGRRLCTSKMHLSPSVALVAVRSKAAVLLLLIRCWLLLPLCDSVIVLCFVVRYFVSILVLQSSRWGREGWLLLLNLSSRCLMIVVQVWLFLAMPRVCLQFVIVVFPDVLTYYFCGKIAHTYMSQCMRFPTMWYVRPAKPQISLPIRAVWSDTLLVAWVFYDC